MCEYFYFSNLYVASRSKYVNFHNFMYVNMAEWSKALNWGRIPFAPSEFKSRQSPIFFHSRQNFFYWTLQSEIWGQSLMLQFGKGEYSRKRNIPYSCEYQPLSLYAPFLMGLYSGGLIFGRCFAFEKKWRHQHFGNINIRSK
jgi:hypothetical protein